MSFFDTEELHAVMLDIVADRGGRAALKMTPSSVQKKTSISFTVASSSRMDGNLSCCGAQAIIDF
jgi:hypothetical protein